MIRGQRVIRATLLGLWAVLLSGLTYFLGGAPLRLLRLEFGRPLFALVTLVLSGGLFFAGLSGLALIFLSLALLVGIFCELEEVSHSFLASWLFTVLINAMFAAGALALWISSVGPRWYSILVSKMETNLKPFRELYPDLQMNTEDLLLHVPSVVIMLWLISLYVSVTLDRKGLAKSAMRTQQAELRMPDLAVWVLIVALFGAIGGVATKPVEILCSNLLNICFVLFFFQGLAIVLRFFETLRMSSFWQAVILVAVVLHLFLFVFVLGVADYWLDFRTRIAKKAEHFKRELE